MLKLPKIYMIQALPGPLTKVYTTEVVPVMTRYEQGGKEYIFLKGIGSTLAGSAVTFDELGITTLLVANAKGPVAFAMGVTVANTWGWYLRSGSTTCQTADDVADNGNVYGTATGGKVDDAVVAGDRVKGAYFRAAGTGAVATVTVQCDYPYVDDVAD